MLSWNILFSNFNTGMKGAAGSSKGGRHDMRTESGVIDGGFFKTKIADIDIVVPIPGQRKRRYVCFQFLGSLAVLQY